MILNAFEPKTILNHILLSPSTDRQHEYHLHVNLVRRKKKYRNFQYIDWTSSKSKEYYDTANKFNCTHVRRNPIENVYDVSKQMLRGLEIFMMSFFRSIPIEMDLWEL